MKLTDYTLSVLKNFSTINSGLVISPGTSQKTMSPERSIFVQAELENDFPIQFGIYDLNLFLGNIATMNNPELSFTPEYVSMSDGTFTLNYKPCLPELIISPPENKKLSLPSVDVKFDMSNTVLTKILRLATMNNLPSLSILGKSGSLYLQAHDKNNASANHIQSKIDDWSGESFLATFKSANLKIIPDDYVVEMKANTFAIFTSKTRNIQYFIALDSTV